jgi:uncharacterized protein (DUF58 family)
MDDKKSEIDPSLRIPASPRARVPVSDLPRLPVSPSPPPRLRGRLRGYASAALGTSLILLGIIAAVVSVYARRSNDFGLATVASILSLILAGLIIVLIVPPLARSARFEVARLDLPIEITTGGGIFLIMVAIVAFAAWNTGNNLLFLVFSLLVSTLFVGWMSARASLRDLVVSARFPDHIYAGESAPVIVTLRNTKRLLPALSTLVEARGPAETNEKKKRRGVFLKRTLAYFAYVPHSAAAEQRVEQLFPSRGHVLINGFELSTRFPFGFLRRRRRLRARNVDLVVYPKPLPIGDELHLLPMSGGRVAAMRRGAGHDLFSLRDYQPQDDLRHIDWKATARARRLTVREFTSEDERRVTVVLDTRQMADNGQGKFTERFERGVTLAASLVKHFIDERAEVRLLLGAEKEGYGSGIEHLHDCLRRLAVVAPKEDATDIVSQIADLDAATSLSASMEGNYSILVTFAAPGSTPARVWRSAHVIYI